MVFWLLREIKIKNEKNIQSSLTRALFLPYTRAHTHTHTQETRDERVLTPRSRNKSRSLL